MPRRQPIKPIAILVWYYRQSDPDCGHSAYDPASHDHGSYSLAPSAPTLRQLDAARRQHEVQRVLARLARQHRCTLDAAYGPIAAPLGRHLLLGAAACLVEILRKLRLEAREQQLAAIERATTKRARATANAALRRWDRALVQEADEALRLAHHAFRTAWKARRQEAP